MTKLVAILGLVFVFMTSIPAFSSDVETRVKQLIASHFGIPESDVTNEKAFVTDLGADELDVIEIIMELEDEFGIEIPDEEAEKITTVQLMIDYAASHQRSN